MPKCPECGIDLKGRDPRGHALDHWPAQIPPDPKHAEAIKRQKILLDMALEQPTPAATAGPGEG